MIKPQIYEKETFVIEKIPEIVEKVVEKVVMVETVVEKIK